jgi:cyclin-dependent kinase 8/11
MRPGDLPAKEGEVFAIKKFKPDKEGDVQTYAGVSQSGAREIMVSEREAGRLERRLRDAVRHQAGSVWFKS